VLGLQACNTTPDSYVFAFSYKEKGENKNSKDESLQFTVTFPTVDPVVVSFITVRNFMSSNFIEYAL
jgi:hypothetical protein